jgi:C1A family cysteine protease
MKIYRLYSITLGVITFFAILSGTALPYRVNRVHAQEISQSPTATISPSVTIESYDTSTPTGLNPTGTPNDSALPDNTETPSPSTTPFPSILETPSPSPTIETANGEFYWKVRLEVPITSTEIQAFGGVNGAENHLEDTLQTEIQDEGVEFSVDTTRVTNSSATYTISLEGSGGIDQFVQTIYSDLENQLNLLNGPILLKVTGWVTTGQIIPIILESNITTGYLWELVSYDSQLLKQKGEPVFEQKIRGIGAPSRQMITLKAIEDGMATVSISYRQPFDRGERQTRFIELSGAMMPDVIDLTNPFQVYTTLPQAPVAAEPAPALENGEPLVGLPATFDWKAEGKVTDVRDQGSCGSCWAFGTVGVMESAILIQSGQSVNLSEQFLVSCNRNGWGCDGGWWAHDYHINTLGSQQSVPGAVLEADMPYTATNGTCRTISNHPYKLTNWYTIAGYTVPSVDQIKNAISAYGPVAAAICTGPAFSNYRTGVFSTNEASTCPSGVNHAIVLTGWDDATQSWVLRNSWGAGWGEAGYMRIKWGTSNVGYAANYVVYSGGPLPTPGGPTPTNTPTPQIPVNDDIGNASTVSLANNQFESVQNITNASNAVDDPIFSCVASRGYKTTWYVLTPSETGPATVNTIGSDYDTILGVWQGSRGSLTSLACNDDIASGQLQSQLNFNAVAGELYLIEAASYSSATSGNLKISVNLSPIPTAVPTSTATRTRTPTPTITPLPPAGYGTYDDNYSKIIYGGGWIYQKVSGNYLGTEHYSKTIGSTTSFTFSGEVITVVYRGYTTAFGLMEVRIDGQLVGSIDQGSVGYLKQSKWSSPILANGTHTVALTHKTGTYVTLDALIVSGPPTATPTATNTFTKTPTLAPTSTSTPLPPVGYGTYDNNYTKIVYDRNWISQKVSGNYLTTEHYSRTIGSSLSFTFSGENVGIVYRGYPNAFGKVEVRIDGETVGIIDQDTPLSSIQNRWNAENLGSGTHTLELIQLTGVYVTLDAIIVY